MDKKLEDLKFGDLVVVNKGYLVCAIFKRKTNKNTIQYYSLSNYGLMMYNHNQFKESKRYRSNQIERILNTSSYSNLKIRKVTLDFLTQQELEIYKQFKLK